MKRYIYKIKLNISKLVEKYKWYSLFVLRNKGYLYAMGWFESRKRNAAIDGMGRPIPWITYPCLTFLNDRIKNNFVVFEYGSGNSTLWWAQRAQKVISCEHDLVWYQHVSGKIPINVKLRHIELNYGGEYSNFIKQYEEKFDVIFIDGRDRLNCLQNSITALNSTGVIIFDNSDDESYLAGINLMIQKGFRRLDFVGPGPITTTIWQTTIFYKANNCLEI